MWNAFVDRTLFGGLSDSVYVIYSKDDGSLFFDATNHWLEAGEGGGVVVFRECVTDDGWIDWPGGECPLKSPATVDIMKRSGNFIMYRSPQSIGANWVHDGSMRDIVAYRVHPKPEYDNDAHNMEIPF
ncbi:hypothetical protein NUKP61_45810 [Klebsiella variicola]|nr:hypothetical protein NUKP61_45810 [Klebsiella variicola]